MVTAGLHQCCLVLGLEYPTDLARVHSTMFSINNYIIFTENVRLLLKLISYNDMIVAVAFLDAHIDSGDDEQQASVERRVVRVCKYRRDDAVLQHLPQRLAERERV